MPTKYTIKQQLKKMPGSYSRNQHLLCIHLDITLRTLEKYISLPKESKQSLSSDMFFKTASYFKINQTDLLTP